MAITLGRYYNFFKDNSPLETTNICSTTAILLLNYQLKVIYYSKEAVEVLNNTPSFLSDSPKMDNSFNLPPKLLEHCDKFKGAIDNQRYLTNFPPLAIQDLEKKQCYYFTLVPAISSENHKARKYDPFLIILIEKITPQEKWIELFYLSKREKEIVELLFLGYSNKDIAKQLNISAYTVEDHLKHLMKKMNVKSRLSIVSKFIEPQPSH